MGSAERVPHEPKHQTGLRDGSAPNNRLPRTALRAAAGDWVRYMTPEESGAEYNAICVPAFSPEAVHGDPA